jgi:L-rhamnose isomerase
VPSFNRLSGDNFFDGSINRIAAGQSASRQQKHPRALSSRPNCFGQLKPGLSHAWPDGRIPQFAGVAVYDQFCLDQGVPAGSDYLAEIDTYTRTVLNQR